MINPYHERIDIDGVLRLQASQHQQTLPLEREVDAATQIDAVINVTSLGHFMLLFFTGDYTTKYLDGEVAGDDGICHTWIQLIDGSNMRELFSEPVPCNLILSPGRRQILVGAGEPSQPLYMVYPFVYTFPLNSQIIVRIRNDSDYSNIVRMAFTGIRIFPQSRQNM